MSECITCLGGPCNCDVQRLTAIRERADELRTTLTSWKDPLRIAAARIAELEAEVTRLEAESADVRAKIGERVAEAIARLDENRYSNQNESFRIGYEQGINDGIQAAWRAARGSVVEGGET